MRIIYKDAHVKEKFSPEYQKKWDYPNPVKIKLLSIENALQQAPCLNDIACVQTYRFHRLKGERKAEWSMRVGNTGYRVVLIPCDEKGKEIIKGDVLAQCKTIKVVKVTEVSKHYDD